MKLHDTRGLRVQGMSASFEERIVLENVTFSVQAGQIVGVIGLNGSGKTTLLRSIACLQKHSGVCVLNGVELENFSVWERSKLIGYCAAQPEIPSGITCLETVLTGLSSRLGLFRQVTAEQEQAAIKKLSLVGLADMAERELQTISGGQRQLVLLARAMVHNPSLLLLDEPDGPLDFTHRKSMMTLLHTFAQESGCCVVITSHDVNSMLNYADRLLLLRNGHLIGNVNCVDSAAAELEDTLSRIYGPVRLLQNGCTYVMTEKI